MKQKLYIFIFISLLAMSCKTASKLYQKGKYDEAVELAAKKLQKDPNDVKLISIIQDAYAYAVNDHEASIKVIAKSNNELKWESMYYEYVSLQKMFDAINKVPAVRDIIRPANYSSYLVTYSEKAGEVRYERGMAFMQRNDKQGYRNAYKELQAALRFIPNDIDVRIKMNEAYDNAVTNIVILPMQQNGGFMYSSYSVGTQNFDDQLIRNLQYGVGNEFVKVYAAWDARSRNIRVDKVVDMQLVDINIGRYRDFKSSKKVSKDVLVKEIVYRPDSIVREYQKVYADIITINRTMVSNALLQVNVQDADGGWLWNQNFTAGHTWDTEIVNYKGDARALSDIEKQLVNRREDLPPSEREITDLLLNNISNDALFQLRNFLNRL